MDTNNFYCKNKSAVHKMKHTDVVLDIIKMFALAFGGDVTDDRPTRQEPCTKQCFECMADVGDTRMKNNKAD